jgi:hypothetical protein
MGMLKPNESKGTGMALLLAALLLGIALALASCTSILESLRRTDTIHTERTVTVRDTTVYTKADSATIKMLMDLQSVRKLVEDLKREGPRTVRGTSHASLVMQMSGDTLLLEAQCDSLAHVLEGALRTIEEKTKERTELERTLTNTKAEQKGVMPGWMKGTIWIVIVLVAAIFLIALTLNKLLFKRH